MFYWTGSLYITGAYRFIPPVSQMSVSWDPQYHRWIKTWCPQGAEDTCSSCWEMRFLMVRASGHLHSPPLHHFITMYPPQGFPAASCCLQYFPPDITKEVTSLVRVPITTDKDPMVHPTDGPGGCCPVMGYTWQQHPMHAQAVRERRSLRMWAQWSIFYADVFPLTLSSESNHHQGASLHRNDLRKSIKLS